MIDAGIDILIIGAGPVGLACGVEASRQGLSHLIVERGALLNTLTRFPTYTVFYSTPELLEIGGVPFVTGGGKPTRREVLSYYRRVAGSFDLKIHLREEVLGVVRTEGGFSVKTEHRTYGARHVVVATGFFDNPNLLGVPGEDLPKVSHYYREPFAYALSDVLVVGGKGSAVEAALELHRSGARVTMAIRGPSFGQSVKYWLRPDIENRVKEGSIRAFFGTTVEAIEPGRVRLRREGELEGGLLDIPNDFVLALTGYRPDFDFLSALGIEITKDGYLVYDPATMETTVPGLYVAGVVAAGMEIGRLFIENGRLHAVEIVRHILEREGRSLKSGLRTPPVGRFQDGD